MYAGSGQSDGTDTRGVQGSAEQRGRANITFEPALEAHRSMVDQESREGNPYNNNWAASILEAVPWDNGVVPRFLGGQDYQNYSNAAQSFEAAIAPILSGANVTEGEAKRIRAAIPQFGDTEQTLAQKARRREQMLNGAGGIIGAPSSFPNSAASRGPQQPRPATGNGQRVFTPAQVRAARSIRGVGTGIKGGRQNPHMINTQAQYITLPRGAWFIDEDGEIDRKP
jgi:hypothetical protein